MVQCQICNDLQFVVKDGLRTPCQCARVKKLRAYFPHIDLTKVPKEAGKQINQVCKDFPIDKNLCLTASLKEDTLNLVILFYLLKLGSPAYLIMNTYEAVEIYLERHPTYKSYLEIQAPCLVLLHGYCDMENKRTEELVLQLIDNYRRTNRFVLFVTRVPLASGSMIERYIRENDWNRKTLTVEKTNSTYLR